MICKLFSKTLLLHLNSRMSVEELIEEPLIVQQHFPKSERRKQVIDMIEKVGLRAR